MNNNINKQEQTHSKPKPKPTQKQNEKQRNTANNKPNASKQKISPILSSNANRKEQSNTTKIGSNNKRKKVPKKEWKELDRYIKSYLSDVRKYAYELERENKSIATDPYIINASRNLSKWDVDFFLHCWDDTQHRIHESLLGWRRLRRLNECSMQDLSGHARPSFAVSFEQTTVCGRIPTIYYGFEVAPNQAGTRSGYIRILSCEIFITFKDTKLARTAATMLKLFCHNYGLLIRYTLYGNHAFAGFMNRMTARKCLNGLQNEVHNGTMPFIISVCWSMPKKPIEPIRFQYHNGAAYFQVAKLEALNISIVEPFIVELLKKKNRKRSLEQPVPIRIAKKRKLNNNAIPYDNEDKKHTQSTLTPHSAPQQNKSAVHYNNNINYTNNNNIKEGKNPNAIANNDIGNADDDDMVNITDKIIIKKEIKKETNQLQPINDLPMYEIDSQYTHNNISPVHDAICNNNISDANYTHIIENKNIDNANNEDNDMVIITDEIIIKKEIKSETNEPINELPMLESDNDIVGHDNDVSIVSVVNAVNNNSDTIDLVSADNMAVFVKFCPNCGIQINRTQKDINNACSIMTCANCTHWTYWCWDCNQEIDMKRQDMRCLNCRKISRKLRNCKKTNQYL